MQPSQAVRVSHRRESRVGVTYLWLSAQLPASAHRISLVMSQISRYALLNTRFMGPRGIVYKYTM